MTDAPIDAWAETLKVLEEAEALTELNARLVGLLDAFKEGQPGVGIEAEQLLSFLETKHASVFKDLPPHVSTKLREALARMAPNDPAAKELLGLL